MRVLLLAFLSILVFGVYAESEWVEDFIDELAKHEEDLAGEATDLNASASREKEETTPKPKTEVGHPVEDDDDDDDDEDEIINPLLSIPNIFKLLRSPAVKPWWMGDNVCVERSESEPTEEETGKSTGVSGLFVLTGTARYQTCQNGPNKYICTTIVHENGKTTKSTVVRKCCKGYRLGHNSCEEIETKPFEEIAKELKCNEFVKNAQDEGIKEELEGAKTIFLPLDSGSKKLDEIDETNNILTNEVVETGRKHTRRSVLENHIVPETVERADFSNDMILKTINNGTIRINGYPSGVVTANCVPINKTDKFTKEGVVHVVERLIETPEKTVAQILEEKYPKFKALLGDADVNQDGITVLAVSDASLSKFEPENVNCLMKILKHHILPRTVCSAPVSSSGKVFVADSQGEYLSFEMDDSNLMAGKVRVLKKDILGTNGVVYEVETLITPPSAVAPIDLLKRTNHTKFLDLLEKSGLKDLFEKAENVTIFVPIEESLEKLENLEKDELVEALKYHIAQGKHYARDLSDSENGLPTKHGESIKISQSRNILASLFGPPTPNVQCSRLRRVDGEVCNGVAHEISSPIIPPKGSVDEILSSPRFSTFKSLLEKTGLIEKLKNRDFTVLAVDNSGMETIKDETKKLLEDDEETRERFAKSHFLPGRVCCSEMDSSSSQWPFSNPLRNLLGQILNWERTRSGSKISGIDIKECDIPAKDGLVHLIKQPLLTSEKLSGHNIKIRRPGSEIILAGF